MRTMLLLLLIYFQAVMAFWLQRMLLRLYWPIWETMMIALILRRLCSMHSCLVLLIIMLLVTLSKRQTRWVMLLNMHLILLAKMWWLKRFIIISQLNLWILWHRMICFKPMMLMALFCMIWEMAMEILPLRGLRLMPLLMVEQLTLTIAGQMSQMS